MASLTPAYGRDYKSKAAVMKDWEAGKDFIWHQLMQEGYVNKDDCPKGRHQIRYNKMRSVMVLEVK
jgi:hypothetical protein